MAEEFARNHEVKPQHLVPNSIDIATFEHLGFAPRDLDILGAGALIPLKQYDVFTDIVASLKLQLPGIKAVHCGEGAERENIKKLIESFGLTDNFSLRGGKHLSAPIFGWQQEIF